MKRLIRCFEGHHCRRTVSMLYRQVTKLVYTSSGCELCWWANMSFTALTSCLAKTVPLRYAVTLQATRGRVHGGEWRPG